MVITVRRRPRHLRPDAISLESIVCIIAVKHRLNTCLPILFALLASGVCLAQEQRPGTRDSLNAPVVDLVASLERLIQQVPMSASDWGDADMAMLAEAIGQTEVTFAAAAEFPSVTNADQLYVACDEMLLAKSTVDELLDQVLATRDGFAAIDDDVLAIDHACRFLTVTSQLIDLSARLRYTLSDSLRLARDELLAQWVDDHPSLPGIDHHEALTGLLGVVSRHGSSIGASVLAPQLLAPRVLDGEPPARRGTSARVVEQKMLALVVATGDADLLVHVVRYLEDERTEADMVLTAAETIRDLGLPQDARPEQDPTLPEPLITARDLHRTVSRRVRGMLRPRLAHRRDALLEWMSQRARSGIESDEYRVGNATVRPGDWLLMRNPSPYNLFSSLTPGLFTHVGVVALEKGTDGKRRMVVVDLPERGTTMPATNVEVFLQRTLHYAFLRDRDAEVARGMGTTAQSVIGNEIEFDLNFRTDGVDALKGKPLPGQKIKAYCAGLLLLTAQESGVARRAFFPLHETPAGGNTTQNLHKIGLVVGENIVSPTAALFSPRLELIGRRRPMYEPTREIQEAVFDHFADSLSSRVLDVSPTVYQSLRLRVAQFAESNELLSRVVAGAAGVSPETDLVAAAKAAAVVELLDRVAYQASDEFRGARYAIRSRTTNENSPALESELTVGEMRTRHRKLRERWTEGTISPRQLRLELVEYYIEQGRRGLDDQFFTGE